MNRVIEKKKETDTARNGGTTSLAIMNSYPDPLTDFLKKRGSIFASSNPFRDFILKHGYEIMFTKNDNINGANTEKSENGQKRNGLLELELAGPYKKISGILNETPRVITLGEILTTYISKSREIGKDEKRMEEGTARITCAYEFVEEMFKGRFRKDFVTPKFAHSSRMSLMAAHLGAGSHPISALLAHDVREDCKISTNELKRILENRTYLLAALLTKPKMSQGGKNLGWISYVSDPEGWERLEENASAEKWYEEGLRHHFNDILNTDAKGITAEMKVKAFLGKILDALDNLVSDQYLNRTNANIRLEILLSVIRHLEVLAPGLRTMTLALLAGRGYQIPQERAGRSKPAKKVMELQPPEKHLSVSYLDGLPAPNGFIAVYSDDDAIYDPMLKGKFDGKVRIELPHNAPENYVAMLSGFFESECPGLEFEKGESLLWPLVEAAGKIAMVKGLKDYETYHNFLKGLEQFQAKLDGAMNGNGVMP